VNELVNDDGEAIRLRDHLWQSGQRRRVSVQLLAQVQAAGSISAAGHISSAEHY
jgi:hypothetical protein